jgi:3-dehydroquinate dehydratase-2
MAHLLLINGPNLNLLGSREPATYGTTSLKEIESLAGGVARSLGHDLESLQSNAEHVVIDRIQRVAGGGTDFLIFNPGGWTHTSVVLRDAILAVKLPFIEVHLSNIYAREEFRRHSYFSDIAVGTICGLGVVGYELAIRAAASRLAAQR